MMARLLRRILVTEFVFWWLLAHFWLAEGGGIGAELATVLGLMLGFRAFVILATYGFAWVHRSAAPEGHAIGLAAAIPMVLEEWAAFVAVFGLIQPFERFFMGEDRLVPGARPPVLLIHGYECNRGFWYWQRARLEKGGWTVATLSLEPVFASIDDYAPLVARRVDEVLAATGAPQLVLVGHSMGGLASRTYLRAHGVARVAKLVTLGSPHHGSWLAKLGIGPNARQMEPGNSWLNELNRPGAVPLPAATTSAYSPQDNYVMPQDSPLLAGARIMVCAGIGHLTMAFSPAITRLLLDELAPLASPGPQEK